MPNSTLTTVRRTDEGLTDNVVPIRAFVAGSAGGGSSQSPRFIELNLRIAGTDIAKALLHNSNDESPIPHKFIVVADGSWVGSTTWRFHQAYGLDPIDTAVFKAVAGVDLVFITPSQAIVFAVANGLGHEGYEVVWGDTQEAYSTKVLAFQGESVTSVSFIKQTGCLFVRHPEVLDVRFSSGHLGGALASRLIHEHGSGILEASRLLTPSGMLAVLKAELPGDLFGAHHSVFPRLLAHIVATKLKRGSGFLLLDGVNPGALRSALSQDERFNKLVPTFRSGVGVGVVTDRIVLATAGAELYSKTI